MDKFGLDDWILKKIIEIVKKYDEIERVEQEVIIRKLPILILQ